MGIDIDVTDGVAWVCINNPERKNAINLAMRRDLATGLEALAEDPSVRVVVLRGEGDTFCAGADVGEFGGNSIPETAARGRLMYRSIKALTDMDKPVIAAIRGAAMGAGWSLAMACDIVVAAETAKFGQIFRTLGLAPDAGSVFFLSRFLGEVKARELVFSGRILPASEAYQLGLINRLVPEDQLASVVGDLVDEYRVAPTLALGMAKRMFRLNGALALEQFLDIELQLQSLLIRSEDHAEGVTAFKEKRSPRFKGC